MTGHIYWLIFMQFSFYCVQIENAHRMKKIIQTYCNVLPTNRKIMKAFVLFFTLILTIRAAAQPPAGSPRLTKFAGKYQSADSRMSLLLIEIKDQGLVLKQLWDNQEISFAQTGPLTFRNEERDFPLEFKQDDKGMITQVVAFNRDVWNRVPDNFKPELQKTISLAPEKLKTLEGKYLSTGEHAGSDVMLQITAAEGCLILRQSWDNREIKFFPVSELEFFNEDQTFPVKFIKDKDGNVTQLIAFNRDVWTKSR